MGRRVKSSLDQKIDLVSGDVGATAWKSAKANVVALHCVGFILPPVFYRKANVRPMPVRVLRHGDGCSEENLPPT